MTNILNVVLMAPSGGQGGGNPMISLVFMLLIIAVFYFFMIRPQVKRQKDLAKYRSSLKKGDKVMTTGGIYGKIVDVNENTNIIEVEIASNVTIKVDKTAVVQDPSDLQQK
jgi:preprotein translocase subunit YajC